MALSPGIGVVQDAVAAVVRQAVPGTPVDVGYPPGGPQPDHVWVSGDGECRYDPLDAVPAHVRETGSVAVHVLCTRMGRGLAAARDAALAIVASAQQALAADLTLGGAVTTLRLEALECREAAADERTRQYGVTVRLSYERYLSR